MRSMSHRKIMTSCAKTSLLGLALISLASCRSGDSSTGTPTSSDSVALQGPIAFVNDTGDKTLTGVTPVHETNLVTDTRPVHLYRDSTDGEVIWVRNDGDNAPDTTTRGDDLINCAPPVPVPGQNYGSSVTILHNSHL
jgi:hypothetical protein